LEVLPGVKIDQHRRIARNGRKQSPEISGGMLLKQPDLHEHFAVISHFLFAGSKMPMPKQRKLFLKRALRGDHTIRPPVSNPAGFQHTGTKPEEEAVGDRLQPPRPCWLRGDPHCGACLRSEAGGGGACRWKGRQARVVNTRMLERWQIAV